MKDKRLGGDTVVPSGLYARLCHAFLVYYTLAIFCRWGQSVSHLFVSIKRTKQITKVAA